MAKRWTIQEPWFDSRLGQIFRLKSPARPLNELYVVFYGYQGLLHRELKRPGREADRSTPSSVEDGNAGSYAFTHTYAFSVDRLTIYCFLT